MLHVLSLREWQQPAAAPLPASVELLGAGGAGSGERGFGFRLQPKKALKCCAACQLHATISRDDGHVMGI